MSLVCSARSRSALASRPPTAMFAATAIETEVRSISTSTFVTDESLVSNRGVAVTSSTTVNAGRLAGYVLSGASVVKTAEV